MIRAVGDADLERVRAFLEAHVETSLFLLGNLAALGPCLGDHPFSGNFKLIEEEGRIVAVFCLTRLGNLLVQAAGRADLAPDILAACREEPIEVRGAVGEWATAQALWQRLLLEPGFVPRTDRKDLLYGLAPLRAAAPVPGTGAGHRVPGFHARALGPADFTAWEALNTAYLEELDLPRDDSPERRRAAFESRARARWWWGTLQGGELVAIAGLNATYGVLGQVGGVYTAPGYRRRGLSRVTMDLLIEECAEVHGFARLILFTGESSPGPRALYESLGFQALGTFGLLLGERRRG